MPPHKPKGNRKKGATRIISLPVSILKQLPLDPYADLLGQWYIENDKLMLRIKEA